MPPPTAAEHADVADAAIARLHAQFPRVATHDKRNMRRTARLPRLSPTLLLTLPWMRLSSRRVDRSDVFVAHADYYADHPLIRATLKTSTHNDYQRALVAFEQHVAGERVTFSELDAVLERFANELFDGGEGTSRCQLVTNVLCAFMHRVPSAAPHFASTRRALQGWRRNSVPRQALPLTRQLTLAFLGRLLTQGKARMALCIGLTWGGLLRANETLALVGSDVALPGDPRLADCADGTAGVLVRSSKTGPMQVALIDDPTISRFVVKFFSQHALVPSQRLFRFGYARLLREMRLLAGHFGLDADRVTMHSCRHGGALTLFLRGTAASTIATRGRWASERTLGRYLRNGRATLMEMRFTTAQRNALAACEAEVHAYVQDDA